MKGLTGERKTNTGHHIRVIKHAVERFKERWDLFPQVVELAYDAFNEGRTLTEEEFKPFFKKGLIKSGYLKGVYRVYKNYLFVFERSQKYYVLITLYPFK